MMKHILLPTDFSENAWNALRYGIELFKKTTCTFHLVHINPIVAYAGGETTIFAPPELVEETLLRKSSLQLQELLKRIAQLPLNKEHTFVTKALHAFFVDSIRQELLDNPIELIIMGTKGASGLKEVAMGSNTGDVMTKVNCPLLAVPESAAFVKPQEIAFPTDYKTGYNTNVLGAMVAMVTLCQAKLRVVHISKKTADLSSDQARNKEVLTNRLNHVEHSFHMVTGHKLETTLQSFVETKHIDMIVMAPKNLNFLQRILFTPTVEKISYHTRVPFLVLHE